MSLAAHGGLLRKAPSDSGPRVFDSLRELVRYRSLLRDLIARDLKVRYKRSGLGILWTMLNPLLLMIIFTIVFSNILRVSVEPVVECGGPLAVAVPAEIDSDAVVVG